MRLALVCLFSFALLAQPSIAEASAAPLPECTLSVTSSVVLVRRPTIKSRTSELDARLRGALVDALKSDGLSLVFDGVASDFHLGLRAEKGHTDMAVDGLTVTVQTRERTVDTFFFERVTNHREWASDVLARLHASSAVTREAARLVAKRTKEQVAAAKVFTALAIDGDDSTADMKTRLAFSSALQTIASEQLTSRGFTVLTSAGMLRYLQDNGIDPEKVADMESPLDVARAMKLSHFLTGSISKVESRLVLLVNLIEQNTGRQLASVQLEGASIRELHDALPTRVAPMLAKAFPAEPAK